MASTRKTTAAAKTAAKGLGRAHRMPSRPVAAAAKTEAKGTSAKVLNFTPKPEAPKAAEVTKITGLTGNQPSALEAALTDAEAKLVTIKATTAEFAMSGAEAEKLVRTAQERMAVHGRKGGPYQTLHAVVRKVAAAAEAQAAKPAPKAAEKPAEPKTAPKDAAKADSKAPQAPAKTEQATGLAALHATSERAAKAAATRAEAAASGESRTCETCGETKKITSFPTTGRNKDGVMGRGKQCRACRDGKTAKK